MQAKSKSSHKIPRTCMRQVFGPGAPGRPRGNQVERELGGGIEMGNTCKSMADSCQCMTKTTTIFKVISLQLIKIKKKKDS